MNQPPLRSSAMVGLVTLALALLPQGAAAQPSGGPNHVVLVSATQGADTAERAGIQVAPSGGPTNTSSNLAQATARDCTGCRSVAAAFQVVFLTGDTSTASPRNAAVAMNDNCTGCRTYAFAFQYVLSTGGPVRLSAEGQAELEQLRAEAARVAASGAPLDQLDAEMSALADQLKALVDEELVAAGLAVPRRAFVDREVG